MDTYRALTPGEIAALEASGSTADDWSSIEVAEDFHPSQLRGARLGGRVRLASGVCIRNSGVRNYDIGAGTLVEEVVRLECRGESAFGNGTEVAVMNENGGRTVRIYNGLTAQIAYMAAVYRHRPALVAALDRMARAGRPTRHAPRKEASAATAASPTAGCCATYVSATGRRSKGSPSSPTARSATFRASASTSRPTTSSRPSMRSSTTVRSSNAAS